MAPTVGGVLIQNYGFFSLGALGVVCNVIVMAVLKVKPMKCD